MVFAALLSVWSDQLLLTHIMRSKKICQQFAAPALFKSSAQLRLSTCVRYFSALPLVSCTLLEHIHVTHEVTTDWCCTYISTVARPSQLMLPEASERPALV